MKQEYRIAQLDELTEHPLDPREGDVGAISVSIEQNGWYGAIIVQKATGLVCAGNHRLKALRALGATDAPIIEVDCDDETALRILLVDNRTNDLATNDVQALSGILKVIAEQGDGLLGTGYDLEDLDRLHLDATSMLPPLPPDPDPPPRRVECPECGHAFDV